jgi:hypothetical protein
MNRYDGPAAVQYSQMSFPTADPFVNESRATHPAFLYRTVEMNRWETPIHNPQTNLEKGFHENIQTRILEKDNYVPKVPVPMTW